MRDAVAVAERWVAALELELPAAVALRRELHASPRLSGDEHDAAAFIERELRDVLSLETVADAGRIGRLEAAAPASPAASPAVAVRAELDALPVAERTGAAFASTNGAMHACGHDVHQAALVALVRSAARAGLPFALAPMLQPREETYPSGALDILESGALERLDVRHVIGAHVHPGVPAGSVAVGDGYINAAADEVRISISGRGGHGAYPHEAQDPVAAIAQIALSLQETVRRTVSPMNPALVSIGTLIAGEGAANVLPADSFLRATVRTTDARDREAIAVAIERLATHTALAFGVEATVEVGRGEPVLLNDARIALGAEHWLGVMGVPVDPPMRSLGADDFSYFTEALPSIMMFAGVREPDRADMPALHDARFLPDDRAVRTVALAMLAGCLSAAEALAGGPAAPHLPVAPRGA